MQSRIDDDRERRVAAPRGSWRDPDHPAVRAVRAIAGLVAITAVVTNFVRAVLGVSTNTPIEVLSQFTNLSCLLLGGVYLLGALVRRERLPRWWDALRGCAAFALVMTGLISALLVAKPGEMQSWDLPWWNLTQHRYLPIVALLEWLVVRMAVRGRWTRPLWWLCYPFAFLAYTWIRGAFAHWYPYGFLDPTRGADGPRCCRRPRSSCPRSSASRSWSTCSGGSRRRRSGSGRRRVGSCSRDATPTAGTTPRRPRPGARNTLPAPPSCARRRIVYDPR